MRLTRWAVSTAIGLLLAGLPVATDGQPDGVAALAQGTDRLPGGVEHVPMVPAPSMSAPKSLPPPLPPPPPAGAAAPDAAKAAPLGSASKTPADAKASKPEKEAPASR